MKTTLQCILRIGCSEIEMGFLGIFRQFISFPLKVKRLIYEATYYVSSSAVFSIASNFSILSSKLLSDKAVSETDRNLETGRLLGIAKEFL